MGSVDRAFEEVNRADFLPSRLSGQASIDMPLPIGYGQTNSQPMTVKMMLRWLGVEPGDKILDVGSGSGWTTALLSHLTGSIGHVYGVELVPELLKFGRQNITNAGIKNASFHQAISGYGLAMFAPYERILVSASAKKLPQELLDQLRHGGKLVIPVGSEILEIGKTQSGELNIISHPGFSFVPLIKPL